MEPHTHPATQGELSLASEPFNILEEFDPLFLSSALAPPSPESPLSPEYPPSLLLPPGLPVSTCFSPLLAPVSPSAHHQSVPPRCVDKPRAFQSSAPSRCEDPLSPPPASEPWTLPWPSDPSALLGSQSNRRLG